MAKGKRVVGYLLFFLLIICSSNTALRSYPVPDVSGHLTWHYPTRESDQPTVIISKGSVQKDWIKIRYMGGECSCNPIMMPILRYDREFVYAFNSVYHVAFVSSNYPVSLKLRGPPGIC